MKKSAKRGFLLVAWLTWAAASGCTGVEERCEENRDCPDEQLCDVTTGECFYECEVDADCGEENFHCRNHRCYLTCEEVLLSCPEGMVSVCGAVCMDVYEASRPDATATDGGSDSSMAVSRAGVIPWYTDYLTLGQTMAVSEARSACAAAGKRLCTAQEWEMACAGMNEYVFTYGNKFNPGACNSIPKEHMEQEWFSSIICVMHRAMEREERLRAEYEGRMMPVSECRLSETVSNS